MAVDSASIEFDPYYKWLGIPAAEQPCNHYRLLGLNLFESDAEVIAAAADRQMAYLRSFQAGDHSQDAQKLLSEVSAARRCLLDQTRKDHYDRGLRQTAAAVAALSGSGNAAAPAIAEATASAAEPANPFTALDRGPRSSVGHALKKKAKRRSPVLGLLSLLVLLAGFFFVAYVVSLNTDIFAGLLNGQAAPAQASEQPESTAPLATTPADEDHEPGPDAPGRTPAAEEPGKAASSDSQAEVSSPPVSNPTRPQVSVAVRTESRRSTEVVPLRSAPAESPANGVAAPNRNLGSFAALTRDEEPPSAGGAAALDIPSDLNATRPVSLIEIDDVSHPETELSLYSCRVMRDSPALELKASGKQGRWAVAETAAPHRPVAYLGLVDTSLQFLWARGVEEELAELLRLSYLIVGTGEDARGHPLRTPQALPSLKVDLEQPRTTVEYELPKLYDPSDIRMRVLSVGPPGLWVEGIAALDGLENGDTVTLTHTRHPQISVDCEFKASGRRCTAEFKFRYQIPGGRKFGLTADHVRRTIAGLQNTLQLTKEGRNALPGLQNDAARIARLINQNTNNAHLRPQLLGIENQIKTARALIANEQTNRKHLQFMEQLVPIGESIQNDVTVSCCFYIEADGCQLPLTAW